VRVAVEVRLLELGPGELPVAVGGVLTPETAARLDVRLVVGPADNQLTDDTVAEALAAPGLVRTLGRETEGLDHEAAVRRVEGVGDTVRLLLKGTRPLREAKALAAERMTGRRV
jgi:valine dehydrogenase (NAD+)